MWSGTRPPSLHALDDLGLTIHIGSFSKNIAPALRVGYIIAPWGILSRMIPLKTDAGSGALEQMALAEFCPHHFDAHLAALNTTLEAKLDNLTEALDQHFGTAAHYTRPPGGIFLWVQLAPGVDTARLAEVALAEGVALNPGHEWYRGADAGRWLRLCFANPSHEVTQAGIARLAAICHREFGTPEVAANQRL